MLHTTRACASEASVPPCIATNQRWCSGPVDYSNCSRLSRIGYLEPIMDREWNDSQPIYRQLRDRVVAMILDGVLNEGDPLPSVRNVAAEYRGNPLTALKGYQLPRDEPPVEKKRGLCTRVPYA